jgi:hypothetical protein
MSRDAGAIGLTERYGIDAKLFDWEPEADCPRKIARNDYDPCGARCPDLEINALSEPCANVCSRNSLVLS